MKENTINTESNSIKIKCLFISTLKIIPLAIITFSLTLTWKWTLTPGIKHDSWPSHLNPVIVSWCLSRFLWSLHKQITHNQSHIMIWIKRSNSVTDRLTDWINETTVSEHMWVQSRPSSLHIQRTQSLDKSSPHTGPLTHGLLPINHQEWRWQQWHFED